MPPHHLVALVVSIAAISARAESVDYEIREVSRIGSRVIATGHREYSATDIKAFPFERDGERISEKLLELEGGFKIGARVFPERELKGFGLIAQQSESDFSWEWFSRESGTRFTKLLGGQKVDVTAIHSPLGDELVEVKFLEDTVLAFKPRGATADTHQIVVKAGSVLRLR